MSSTDDSLSQGQSALRVEARVPMLRQRPPAVRQKAIPTVSAAGLRASVTRALDERRLFVLVPVFIIAGLVASLAGSFEPHPIALAGVGAVIAVALLLSIRAFALFRMLVLFAAFWTGFGLLTVHGAISGTQMLRYAAFGSYEMRVDEVLSSDAEGQRIVVSQIQALEGARVLPIRRARVALGAGAAVASGDVIRLKVRFYPVPGPVLPNGYDGQFTSYFDGVGAYGTATSPAELIRAGDASAPARVIATIRNTIAARIDAALSSPSAGIARAIITGDQSAVTDDARDVMATAGIAHVLSVSGLHLTLVAGGVFAAVRLLLSLSDAVARRLPAKRVAALGGVVAAVLYFAISGGNVAAVRATVMILLVLGAVIFGRRALTMRNVAIAALVVLFTDPASVFMPSFQLSFAAVVALIGAWELNHRRERPRQRGPLGHAAAYLVGAAATSIVAGAATLLFSAYHFQQTSPLGVIGNLLTLPLVGFVMMPAALLAVLAMPFGIESPLLTVMGWSVDRMLDLARLVAMWSGGIDASPLLTPVALVIGMVALGWFAFFTDRWRLLAPILGIPAVLLFGLDRPPDVLVADSTQALAVRTDDGLRLVAGRPGSFAVEVWQETYGDDIGKAPSEVLHCDSIACLVTGSGGFRLALETDPAGFFEDCATADLVVTRLRAPASCAAGTVIDADDLARQGVHWLRWDASAHRFEVRPAIADLGRPWRLGWPDR